MGSASFSQTMLHWFCAALILLVWKGSGVFSKEPHKLVCYYNSSATYRQGDGKFTVSDIDPHLCTHIIYNTAGINSYFEISILDPELSLENGKDDFRKFLELRDRNPDLKLMIGIFGHGNKSEHFSKMAKTPERRETFINSVIKFLNQYSFDGINIDWIHDILYDTLQNRKANTHLIKELREKIPPPKILSITGSCLQLLSTNIGGISKYVDFVNLWAFEMHEHIFGETGHSAPLHKYPKYGYYHVDSCLGAWFGGRIKGSKLILGFPAFGRSYTLQNASNTGIDSKASPGYPGRYTNESGILGYNELVEDFNRWPWIFEWDDVAKAGFAYLGHQWVSYETDRSVMYKLEYIHYHRLGGAMVYSIDTDDFRGVGKDSMKFHLISTIKKGLSQAGRGNGRPRHTRKEPHKLVCYYASWANYRPDDGRFGSGKFTANDIDPHLCTHIISTSAGVDLHGEISILDPNLSMENGMDDFRKFLKLRDRNPDLKLMIGIGGQGHKSEYFSRMAATPQRRKIFINSVIKFLNQYSFDGINIDWMYPGTRYRKHYVALLKELREEIPHPKILSIVGASGNKRGTDVEGISKYVDFVNLWSFDLQRAAWAGQTGYSAALYTSPQYRDLTVDDLVFYWLKEGIDRSKLILGFPAFGRSFTLQNDSNTGTYSKASPGYRGRYTDEAGLLGYNELVEDFNKQPWTHKWDDVAKAGYAYLGNQWVSYDNESSIRYKLEYLNKKKLGGAMVYSLDTDDFRGIGKDSTKFHLTSTIKKGLSLDVRGNGRPHRHIRKECTAVGQKIRDPEDCGRFFSCTEKADGSYEKVLHRCPRGLGFHERTQFCDYKISVPGCPENVCTKPGRLVEHPEDCTRYFSCTEKAGGSYGQVQQDCSRGLGFNVALHKCDYPQDIPGCLVSL